MAERLIEIINKVLLVLVVMSIIAPPTYAKSLEEHTKGMKKLFDLEGRDNVLLDVSNDFSTTLPRQIDKDTKWTAVWYDAGILHYTYNFVGESSKQAETLDRTYLKNHSYNYQLNNICTTPFSRALLKNDIKIKCTYYTEDRIFLYEYEYEESSCTNKQL